MHPVRKYFCSPNVCPLFLGHIDNYEYNSIRLINSVTTFKMFYNHKDIVPQISCRNICIDILYFESYGLLQFTELTKPSSIISKQSLKDMKQEQNDCFLLFSYPGTNLLRDLGNSYELQFPRVSNKLVELDIL